MKVSLSQIKAASKCLKYFRFLEQAEPAPESEKLRILKRIIQKCYVQAADTGYKPQWRRIVGWLDKEMFQSIDVSDKELFEKTRKQTERNLKWLRKWYKQMLLPEQVLAYPDILVATQQQNQVLEELLFLVKAGDVPTVLVLSEVERSKGDIYNDIRLRGMAWMLSESLNQDMIMIQELTVGQDDKYKKTEVKLGKKEHLRAKKMIVETAKLIEKGYDFPSVTEQCQTCPFKRRCFL